MKKNYLLIAAAAAMFAACSSNDTFKEVNEDVAIGFGYSASEKITRAELTNEWFANNDDNSFGVYGYRINGSTHEQIFTNEQVTWYHDQSDWKHNTVRFWDKSKAYNFYAYAPYAADATWDATNEKFSFNNLPLIRQIDAVDNNTPLVSDIAIAIKQGVYYSETTSGHVTTSIAAGHHSGDVEFVFSHILSKLAFNVKSSTDPKYARIRVTEVKMAFPTLPASGTASWAQNGSSAVTGTTTISGPLTAQTAIASNGTVTDANFTIPVFTMESGSTHVGTKWLNYDNNAESHSAIALEEWTWSGTPLAPAGQNSADNKAKEFIVVPVETASGADVTGYEFAIKVVYDIQYMKLADNGDPTDLNDYEADTQELGCVATGIITAANYHPDQNELWTVTIDVNPAQIEFCVQKINGWDPEVTTGEIVVK